MRSVDEQTLSIKLSVNEAFVLFTEATKEKTDCIKDKESIQSIRDRLEDALISFYRSKPNILDYPLNEWKRIEEVFKFCMDSPKGGVMK